MDFNSFFRRSLRKMIALGLLFLLLGLGTPEQAQAISYTFTQTNWSGAVDNTLSPSPNAQNVSNWSYVGTSSPMVVRSASTITTLNATGTITQTDDGSTAAGFNFSGSSFTSTSVTGSGTSASIRLTRAKISTSTVTAGYQTACVLNEGGFPYCWGNNVQGAVGAGSSNTPYYGATPVYGGQAWTLGYTNDYVTIGATPYLANVRDIDVGHNTTCAVTWAGRIYCWGDGGNGRLGNNAITDTGGPVQVYKGEAVAGDISNTSYLGNIKYFATGDDGTCAISNAGNPYCWGAGTGGRMGIGNTSQKTTPVRPLAGQATGADASGGYLVNAKEASVGSSFSCILTNSGHVYCMGTGTSGQIGTGVNGSWDLPQLVTDGEAAGTGDTDGTYLSNIAHIFSGYQTTCALSNAGNLYCWGENYYGQVGNGTTNDAYSPARVRKGAAVAPDIDATNTYLTNVSKGEIFDYTGPHTCVDTTAGNAYCWGNNGSGVLGNDLTSASYLPVRVLKGSATETDGTGVYLGSVVDIAAGEASVGITAAGNVYAWGGDTNGAMGNGGGSASRTPDFVLKNNSSEHLNSFAPYNRSGTYTSGILDTGRAATFLTLSYATTSVASTSISVQLRSGNVSNLSDAGAWATVSDTGSLSALNSGGTHRYVQYKVIATSTDGVATPTFDSIAINYGYQDSGFLISNGLDSGNVTNVVTSLNWAEPVTSNAVVSVSLRTNAISAAYFNSLATSTGWIIFSSSTAGCTRTIGAAVATTSCTISSGSSLRTGSDDRYMQYKADLTANGTSTATVNYVRVGFAVNNAPAVSISGAGQNATSTDPNWGRVQIAYTISDTDSPASTTRKLEYSTGTVWIQFLSATNTVPFSTTTVWLATSTVPNTYTSAMQVRVTANDGDIVNATGTATSSNFEFDSKVPAISTFRLDSRAGTDLLSISSADDTTQQMRVYDSSADTGWISYATTRAWTPVLSSDNTEFVNLQVRDKYGNLSSTNTKAPAAPTGTSITDQSVPGSATWSEKVQWTAYTPPTSSVVFSNYQVYRSTDGSNYLQLGVSIVTSTINYYVDTGLSSSTTYYYKVTVTDTDGDVSNYSSVVYDQPDGGTAAQFQSASASAAESVTSVTIPVQLSGVSMNTVTVDYAVNVASSTATGGGADYTLNSGTLTFTPGQTSKTISMTVVNDSSYEGNETVTVALSNLSGATLGTNGVYTYTILEDESAPTVTFSTSTASIHEGSSASFKILLSNSSGVTTTVPFTLGGTASFPSDYTVTGSPVLIPAGQTSSTITIVTIDNSLYAGDKTIVVTMGTPTNATAVPPTTYTATVTETTAAPTISISDVTQSEGNSGTTAFNFSVTLSSASVQTITVAYATVDGTAAVTNSDYAAASGTLSFSAGQTSKTITVNVTGDTTYEANETFTVGLSNASPSSTVIFRATGTGTIMNDDFVSTVQFSSASASNSETVTTYDIPISVSPSSGNTITVDYTVSGSAVSGTDFTIASSSPLSIPVGTTSTILRVTVINDSLYEGTRALTVTLSNPSSNATLGATASFTYTITDDESMPSVTIEDVSTTEGDSGTKTLSFPMTLSGGARTTTTVNYTTADGTATAGSDYVAASGVATFSPGRTTSTIPVTVTGDLNYEPDETFAVNLSGASGITISRSSATGTIINDDSQPSVSINSVTLTEGNSGTTSFAFTVTLAGPTSGTTTVSYATADGTATAGSDYTAVSGTLTFSPGQTSKTITVNVTGDTTYEADEIFTVTLSNPSGAVLGTATGSGTITNDDTIPVLQFSSASASNSETVTTYDIPISVSPSSGNTITVDYTVSGSAVSGTDFTIASSSPLSIPVGTTSTILRVTVINDSLYEGTRALTVTLSNPSSNATLGATVSFTYTITDDESMPSVTIEDASTTEGDSGTKTLSFPMTLSGGARATTTVNYTTADGTATAGSDYVAASGVATFSPGRTTSTIPVTVTGDTTFEPDETFSVLFSNPSADLTIARATGIGTIVNDDTVSVVQFGSATSSAAETSGPYSVPITVTPASGNSITSDFSITGTGILSTDYTLSTASPMTVTAGSTTSSIIVTPINDALYEGSRTVVFTLSNPSSNATLGATASFTYTITDDESMPSVTIEDASTTEGDSGTKTLSFPMTLSGGARATTTVNYTTADGTATLANSDYSAASGTLVFSSGQTSKTISVSVLGDTNYESDETFAVNLSGASGITISRSSATGTIINDDSQPSVSINSVTLTEGNSGTTSFAFTVTLAGPTSGTTTVSYATADGTATAGSDYTAVSGTLTFSPGQTSKTITVNVTGDTTYEADEIFTVTLSNPSGAVLGTATGSGTITNDDGAPTIQFGALSSSGRENITSVLIPVSLSVPSAYNVTVNYAVTGGTATVGDDYSFASTTFTVSAGATQGNITLTIVNDILQESDETVIVALSNPVNATFGSATTYTYTIMNDDIISGVAVMNVKSTVAKVIWTTTLPGTSVAEYGLSSNTYTLTQSDAANTTDHALYLSNLAPGTTYYLRAKSVDNTAAVNVDDNQGAGYTFTTNNGPIITSVASSDILDTTAVVTWNTDKYSNATVVYSTTSSLANSVSVTSPTFPQETGGQYPQTVTLTGLQPQTTYFYKVRSTDLQGDDGEEWNGGLYYAFTTTQDQTAPNITNIQIPIRTMDSGIITWQTSEAADGMIGYGTSSGAYSNTTDRDLTMRTTHSQVISGLNAGTTYYFTVTSRDNLTNSTTSAEQSFQTTTGPDVTYIHVSSGVDESLYNLLQEEYARLKDLYDKSGGINDTTPPVISNVRTESIGAFIADIKWDTNEPATSFLEYGETTGYGQTAGLPAFETAHALSLKSLKMGTTYHYRVTSADKNGNKTISADYIFQTLFAAESLEDLARTGDISQFQDKLQKLIESVTPSLVPPIILDVKVASTTETGAMITWRTNVEGSSIVAIAEDSNYKSAAVNPYTTEIGNSAEKVKIHTVVLSDLKVGTTYHFLVKTLNIFGVAGKGKDLTFTTKFGRPDLTVSDIGQTQANIKWVTDKKTTSYAEYKDLKTGKIFRAGDDIFTGAHVLRLVGLAQDGSYEVRGYGTDERGNTLETVSRRFRTSVDTVAPVISGVKIENAIMPNRTDRLQTIVFWKTGEPATSQIFYQEGSGKGDTLSQQSVLDTDLVTDHAVILTTFKPSTVYRVQVVSKDPSGNTGASKIQSILTPQKGESIIDIISRNFEQSFQWLKQLR